MKTKVLIIILLFVLSITSCDPGSSVEYTICNMSHSDAVIELKEGVWYSIIYKDSITSHSSTEEANVILRHEESVSDYYAWMNHRIEEHTPLWEEIISIRIGDSIVAPQNWNSADCWQKRSSKDMFGEEINYILYLR